MMAIFKSPPCCFPEGQLSTVPKIGTRDNFNKRGGVRAPTSKIDQAILSETHNNFGHLVKWNGTLNIQFVPQ